MPDKPSLSLHGWNLLRQILLFAALFALIGKLSLWLATAPSHATAVFPPAGLALAAVLAFGRRLLWAAALGQLMLQYWLAKSAGYPLDATRLLIATTISLGTVLQILTADWLIRRWADDTQAWLDDKKITISLLLGGPLACLISPTMGLGILWLTGAVPTESIAYGWWTWWVGDTIGVVVFTPLTLAFIGQPRSIWRPRMMSVAAPMLMGTVIVSALFFRASEVEKKQLQTRFDEKIQEATRALQSVFSEADAALTAGAAYFNVTPNADAAGFTAFMRPFVERLPGVKALQWAPRVTDIERDAYETRMRGLGYTGYVIQQREANNRLQPAVRQAEYYPIEYIIPLEPNRVALGLNVQQFRETLLQQAAATGRVMAMRPIVLVQDTAQEGYALVLHKAVYAEPRLDAAPNAVRGYLLGIFRVRELLAASGMLNQEKDLALSLRDVTDASTVTLFERLVDSPLARDYQARISLDVGGRLWELSITPTQRYLASNRPIQAWLFFVGGMLCLAFMQMLLLSTTGRAAQVESQVQRRTRELRDNEERLKRMISSPLVGVCLWKGRGLVYDANDAFLAMIGYTREELATGPIDLSLISPEPERPVDYDRWQRIAAGEPLAPYEKEFLRRDGSILPVLVSAHLFDDQEWCVSFVFDMSRQKEIEEELRRLNLTLEKRVHEELQNNREKDHLLIQQARFAAMGEMIGNIAHQWRQPLNALSFVLENVRDAHQHGELDKHYVDELVGTGQNIVQKMSATIDDFRNFFRPDKHKQPFSLRAVVHRSLELTSATFQAHQITADVYWDADVSVLGFENEYSQVLLNLLSNAKDAILAHNSAGGTVTIVIEQRGAWGAVIIADDGGGIPSPVIDKIFDPYFTTREQGTGIGLYMSKMIVENNMGGRIEVRNAGLGAEFTVLVPLAPASVSQYEPATALVELQAR